MDNQQKEVFLAARVTPAEKEKVMGMAEKAGMSLGRFLLALVDQYESVEVKFIPKAQPRGAGVSQTKTPQLTKLKCL